MSIWLVPDRETFLLMVLWSLCLSQLYRNYSRYCKALESYRVNWEVAAIWWENWQNWSQVMRGSSLHHRTDSVKNSRGESYSEMFCFWCLSVSASLSCQVIIGAFMLICARRPNQPAARAWLWPSSPHWTGPDWSGSALTRPRQSFYCPLPWSMTQSVEVALTGCGPSHRPAKAVAESAAAAIKTAIESTLSLCQHTFI